MVHTFGCLDRFFMLDVESGSFYEIDELTKKLIDEINSPNEQSKGEFSRYSEKQIEESKQEINDLMKEGVLFSVERTHTPRIYNGIIKSMCLNISHDCNLACEYCFADGGSYKGLKMNMDSDVAKRAIDFLIERSSNRRYLEVDFFGGEPLLNFDVVKQTVEYARQREKETGKEFRFTITTNAVALTPEISEFINREMYNVVISIDGRKDVHNRIRKTRNGKDSFDIILKNALAFRKIRGDKQYYIRGTFTSLNKDFAADALALNDYGFDQISLEPVVLPDNNPLAITEKDLPEIEKEYEILAAEYLRRRRTDKWFGFFHFNIDLEGGPCETKRLSSCGAGCEYVAVTPSGDIYPCHQFCGIERYKMGNILKGTFDKTIPEYFIDNILTKKEDCPNCWAKYYCSGGCAANSVNFYGTLSKQHKTSCAMMRKRIECALALHAIEKR